MPTVQTPITILESGDRLTRAEFHRRYCAHPEIKKAELVEGVVYVASPVRVLHSGPHGIVLFWLNHYRVNHPGLQVGDNGTVLLDADNEPQPDAAMWRDEVAGPHVNEEGYLEGAPQLVVEVAASSASYDLHDKLRAYRRNGVQEYIVWTVLEDDILWFRLDEGEYVRVQPDATGVIESAVFHGLRLNIAKMVAGDLAGILAELQPRT